MRRHSGYAWRAAALAGLVAGLLLAAPVARDAPVGLGVLAALGGVLALSRPRRGRRGAVPWLGLVTIVAALTGLWIGTHRLGAIDSGRLTVNTGTHLDIHGTVVSAPRTSGELTRFTLEAPAGRTAVEVRTALPSSRVGTPSNSDGIPTLGAPDEGSEVIVGGALREPAIWERSQIERSGASLVLAADSIDATGATRGGLRGALDDIRRRAESALERGTRPVSAALLRGFVLGQDDRIPEDVRDEFRRSGLAHVLAVSGQNVMLLAILATPL
ncbi:MAG: ComEC/Rec2 family competence protein, partial [Solirubrobacterales bacterium]